MSHFAQIDGSNVVLRVTVGGDDADQAYQWLLDNLGGTWVRTWYDAATRPDRAACRYNFAGVGDTFDAGRNAFIPPKPFASWVLDESTCQWGAPVAIPAEGGPYVWDEINRNWAPL
jgi:hypothetical protein